MFIKCSTIKESIKQFIKTSNTIKRIFDIHHNVIGFLLRKEIKSTNTEVSVLFSISINDFYRNHSKKVFSQSEYKYFGIQHLIQFDKLYDIDKEFNFIPEISENNTKNILAINNYLVNLLQLFDFRLSEFNIKIFESSLSKQAFIDFILASISNTQKYYKNKKLNIFFIHNLT